LPLWQKQRLWTALRKTESSIRTWKSTFPLVGSNLRWVRHAGGKGETQFADVAMRAAEISAELASLGFQHVTDADDAYAGILTLSHPD